MEVDWNLKILGQCFQFFFFRIPAKITNKINKLCAPWWNLLDIFLVTLQEHFVCRQRWCKSDDFNTNWPETAIPSWHGPLNIINFVKFHTNFTFAKLWWLGLWWRFFSLAQFFTTPWSLKNWPMLQPYMSLKCLLEFSEEPRQMDVRYEEHLHGASIHFFQHHKSARNNHGNFLGSTFQ